MAKREGAWIEVWPFNKKAMFGDPDEVERERFGLSEELSNHVEELWKPKAEKGWKSSWVAFLKEMHFTHKDYPYDEAVNPVMGVMTYKEIEGINNAIENGLPFAPEQGYTNCLSVGFPTATKDGKVIFQRRPSDVHCPNILIHEPCGYMASMAFAPRAECDDEKYANDPRLFSLETQLNARKKEIADTFGVDSKLVSYQPGQDFLGAGWQSIEMYFSTTGRIDANEGELKKPKGQEIFFVPFEHLKDLIHNQGRLSKVDPTGYRPDDPREIPLIDESLVGLIWGYESLTGERLDIPETVDRLNGDGLEIRVYDTSPGRSYDFPSSF